MNELYNILSKIEAYSPAVDQFQNLISLLQRSENQELDHGEVESLIEENRREILKELFQAHLTQRHLEENEQTGILGDDEVFRNRHRRDCSRSLQTIFGEVRVRRFGYSALKTSSLFPLDGELNLPPDKYSDGLRRLIALESSQNSFDACVETIFYQTGTRLGKRQVEEIAVKVSQDFVDFYQERNFEEIHAPEGLIVMTTDGKGIVMKKEDLRESTRKAAAKEAEKPAKARLGPGEKKNRKRMACVASVYSIQTQERIAEEIMGIWEPEENRPPPKPENKRVWASVERDFEEVVQEMFEEAVKRDPDQKLPWVALVDGDSHQIERIKKEAKKRKLNVTIILDLIHVIEYLWSASYCLFDVGSLEAQNWVKRRILETLRGKSSHVAGGMRRSATNKKLTTEQRKSIDKCANYLSKYRHYLKYDEYCRKGFPIATGVIEGACRYLIKDRMDITGARWSLKGAEAILKLRAIRASHDFEEYWKLYKLLELQRNHLSKYREPLDLTLWN